MRNAIGVIVLVLLVLVGLLMGFLAANREPIIPFGCIAQIDIFGPITFDGRAREIAALIREADRRIDVRGLLVSINSHGGSIVAAKELFQALSETKKPTWVHISDAALSGGYFVAAGADKIWADSMSLTGNIGVRATVIDISQLLEKLGINTTTIKSGELKDIADILKPLTPREREIIEGVINQIFEEFKSTVIAARSTNERFSITKFTAVLDARILTGREAHDIGLVDNLGSYFDALSALGEEVGLGDRPAVCKFALRKDIFSLIFGSVGHGIGEALIEGIRSESRQIVST